MYVYICTYILAIHSFMSSDNFLFQPRCLDSYDRDTLLVKQTRSDLLKSTTGKGYILLCSNCKTGIVF